MSSLEFGSTPLETLGPGSSTIAMLCIKPAHRVSYVNYPVYVHPPPVRSYEQYPKKVGKIIETWFGLGTVPREDESVQEYLVENQERPRLLIELAVWSAMGGFFALRDGFRTISKKLHGVCLHPSSFVCAEEALYSEKTYKEE